MSGQKRCENCKQLYSGNTACPICGYGKDDFQSDIVSLLPGTVLNARYNVGMVLGNGGFGITYLAWDEKLDQKVAVKEYFPSELSSRGRGETMISAFSGKKGEYFSKGKAKFIEEARILKQFEKDPAVVNVIDYFEEHGTVYLVMEYIDGQTISERIKDQGNFGAEQTVQLLLPIIDSLKGIHAQGLIHRDIAPDNIMITKDGRAKLIDFGSARYAAFNTHEKSLTVMVKQGYSAPEQYMTKGDRGPFTDVYALGATMYKMLTGVTPPESLERKTGIMEGDGDSLESISKYAPDSAYLEPVILDAMNVFAKKRIQNMQELSARLHSANSEVFTAPALSVQDTKGKKHVDQNQVQADQKTLLIDEQDYLNAQKMGRSVGSNMNVGSAMSASEEYHTQYDLPSDEINDKYTEEPDDSESKRNKVIWTSVAMLVVTALVVFLCIFIPKHRQGVGQNIEAVEAIADAKSMPEEDSSEELQDSLDAYFARISGIAEETAPPEKKTNETETSGTNQLNRTIADTKKVHEQTQNDLSGQETTTKSSGDNQEKKIIRKGQTTISAGSAHTVGVKSNGTVVSVGSKHFYGLGNAAKWKNIASVSAGGGITVGLKTDGTVVAVGMYADSDVESWKDIVSVAAGADHVVGIKTDGTVESIGYNTYGQCNTSGWTNIVAVSAGNGHTVGLKSNGKVVATGRNLSGQCAVSSWTDIVAVAAGGLHTVGLKSDGTVVAVGYNGSGQCEVSDWTDIVAVAAGSDYTIGLKSDGTVVAVGNNDYGQCEVSDWGWTDIVAIDAGDGHTVGLRSDGTVVAIGMSGNGQCDVSDWSNIKLP